MDMCIYICIYVRIYVYDIVILMYYYEIDNRGIDMQIPFGGTLVSKRS